MMRWDPVNLFQCLFRIWERMVGGCFCQWEKNEEI